MKVKNYKVGIIAHRFQILGGIQTCFIELIQGLNDMGITPDVLWDEPTDWEALKSPAIEAGFRKSNLFISSKTLRSLPPKIAERVRWKRLSFASFPFNEYNFIYSFEPGVKIPEKTPNVCWMIGPPFVDMPGEAININEIFSVNELRKLFYKITTPSIKPDKYSRYVTHSDWIAQLCEDTYGFSPPVIWPPARDRKLILSTKGNRRGILYLSRLTPYKRPDIMLTVAEKFKDIRITIAGTPMSNNDTYVESLQRIISERQLVNVDIIKNPSENKVAELLNTHEYFIFPAKHEHFGIVTVEAIQSGLIPIVHNSGGQKEIVPINNLLFNNDKELLEKISFLLSISKEDKGNLRKRLFSHTQRGTADNYRNEMLKFLINDLKINTN